MLAASPTPDAGISAGISTRQAGNAGSLGTRSLRSLRSPTNVTASLPRIHTLRCMQKRPTALLCDDVAKNKVAISRKTGGLRSSFLVSGSSFSPPGSMRLPGRSGFNELLLCSSPRGYGGEQEGVVSLPTWSLLSGGFHLGQVG